MDENYILLQRITKNYKDPNSGISFQALSGIDLRIPKGSFTSIIGPSGAGKTTLLSLISGIIKPSTGSVYIDGIPIQNLSEEELTNYRRYTCGYLWQDFEDNLIVDLTVEENLMQAFRISGFPTEKREIRLNDILTTFKIHDRRNHRINQLSGGEALRASLAMALINNPDILVADEPTGELDASTSKIIVDYLKLINQEFGTTIIVATHNPQFYAVSDRTYDILDGTITGIKGDTGIDDKETLVLMNALGQIQIPAELRDKYKFDDVIRLIEDEENGQLILKKID